MEIESVLQKIGLNKQESEVYLNTLKLGLAKASQIAQKTRIRRGAIYYSLKLLKERGLISEVISSGVQHFKAVSPERIIEIIKEEKENQVEAISSILPSLKNIQSTSLEQPLIEVFEGYGGFKSIFSKLLDSSPKQLRCYMSSKILSYLPHFHEQFRKRRLEKGISIRTITEKNQELDEIKKLDKKELRETRYYNNLFLENELLYYILDDAIIIIKGNDKEQIAFYIKEKNLAFLQRNVFDELWKIAKK